MFDYSGNIQDNFLQLGSSKSVVMDTGRLPGVYFHIHNVTKLQMYCKIIFISGACDQKRTFVRFTAVK